MRKLAVALSVVVIGTTVAFAGPVEDRQALMKANGQSMGQLAGMAKGEKPFDAAAVEQALAKLGEDVQKFDVAALFPAGTDTGNTEASPKIWEDMAGFTAAADAWNKAVTAAVAAKPQDVAALGIQVGEIGKTCGGCHELYRVKK